MKRHSSLIIAAASLLASLAFASPAAAQLDHLNVDRLIKDLRERGMSDLLIRLSEDGSIKDPADAMKLRIEMLIMRAQTPVANNPNDLKERIASLEQGVAQFVELIKNHRDNTKRPLWQADLALHLLYTRMALNNLADDFYEFGVPTKDQTAVFESGAAMATEHLIDAVTNLNKLQRDLPRADDYNQAYVNTGRWEELMDEYLKTKVPFLLSQAAYLASLLPDTHPYYQNLGRNPNIPLQAATPAAERTRLLNLAVDNLVNIPPELALKYGLATDESGKITFIRPITLTRAKALMRLGKFDEAMPLLEGVAREPKDDLLAFRAHLSTAIGLELKTKSVDQSMQALEVLKDHPLTQVAIGFPIIITDLQHRLLLKHAGKDKAKIEAAYQPYDALLSDKRLAGQRLLDTRMFVYERWTKLFADVKQDALPPMVLSGMGEMERLIGNEHVAKWAPENAAAAKENDAGNEDKAKEHAAKAEAFMKEARVHLDKCIDISDVLINRTDVPAEVKARARYNKAYSSYLKNPESGQAYLQAAAIWTELANELPTHPLAEEAIGLAVRFLHNLHIREPRPDGVDAAYRNTCAVLYAKLPASQVADDERTYYTFNVLQADRKYAEAAASYEKVSEQHVDYVEAQREWMFCQMQLWRQMPEAQRPGRRDVLRDEVTRIERVAREELERAGDARRRQMLKTTLGDLVLTKVELDMDRQDWDEADRVLRNFAEDYPDEPDLIRLAMSRRIMVKVKQGESDAAVALAKKLVEEAGEDAARQESAASAIDASLTELADEIENLRAAAEIAQGTIDRTRFLERATSQAAASDKLADMLLKWATDSNRDEDEMFRYRLIKVRSSVLTDKRADAEAALSPLAAKEPADPRVIFLQGEVLFMTGKDADLKKAIGYYMKITRDLTPQRLNPQMTPMERGKQDTLNRLWWQSWLRLLQIYDKLKAHTDQIPRLVDQLESQYPDLGGPAMRGKFHELGNRHRK